MRFERKALKIKTVNVKYVFDDDPRTFTDITKKKLILLIYS